MQCCIRVTASLKSEKTDWEGGALGLGLNTTRAGTRGAQSSVRPIPRFTHAFELTKSMLQALKEFMKTPDAKWFSCGTFYTADIKAVQKKRGRVCNGPFYEHACEQFKPEVESTQVLLLKVTFESF